ncbi:MAG: DUF4832 domain-containing protein [Ktedonobacteraceae bacterium]|nr:DUF4832 domain-containing protein [Ktedonobacteraceae bacterium]
MVYSVNSGRMRLILLGVGFLLLFLLNDFSITTPVLASSLAKRPNGVKNSRIVASALSNETLINPGQGWVLYGIPKDQSPKTLSYGSVGYMRYNWSDVEPQEGVYNWPLIDNNLNAWTRVGKKFAFGVMNANSSTPTNKYVTPQWVFKDGAHSVKSGTYDNILQRKGIQYVPVWDDPIFLQKVQDFARALAQRYDGNPDIAFIDIRSYGNWGAQDTNGLPHSVLLTPKGVQDHILIYRNAFKHTQLICPWGSPLYKSIYAWAADQHIGLRRDGIMVESTGSELTLAYGKAPIVFEFYSTYQWLKLKNHWGDAKMLSDVAVGKPSYINLGQWGNDAQVMLAQQPKLVQKMTNMMGYHFVLSSATIPNTITNRQANTISLSWKNSGVSYLYQPASVAVALLDKSNNVVQKQWLPKVNPQTWMPGKTTITSTNVTFAGVHAGTYKLAVGLFAHTTNTNPTYLIGNKGRTSLNWYVISSSAPVK